MNRAPRIRGLADDHHEAVQALATELSRDGLTTREAFLVDRFRHLSRRLEFECEMHDYKASLDRADPWGRRMRRERSELERTYGLHLPPLPDVPALPGGERE